MAERIPARLRARGVRAERRSVADVQSVAAHDAVVLGSPCYGRSWLPEVDRFVRDNLGELAGRPAWLFSVGAFGDRHRLIGRLATREPKNIGDLRDTIDPRDYRVFAGVIERHQWPLAGRLFFWAPGGRSGDSRDWDEIEAWAAASRWRATTVRSSSAGSS